MQSTKKKKVSWQQYIGTIFMIFVGAVCGILMVEYMDSIGTAKTFHEELLSLAGLFVGMYIAMIFHTIVHEAGHLLFGLFTGYGFSSFRIFSFMWMKENGKVKLKRLSIPGTAGQCLMQPPDMRNGKIPFVLYNLGGSFMNLFVGLLFLLGYFSWPGNPFVEGALFLLAITGFLLALMNGIPMRMGMVDNDGNNVLALSKDSEALEAFWVQLKIAEQVSKGIRLKDMPAIWFKIPSDDAMKNSMVAVQGVFACNRLMDQNNFETAKECIAHMLEMESGIVALHRHLLICDQIFLELIGPNRREVIQGLLSKEQKKFMKSMKNMISVLRTEYALAVLFENDYIKAEKIKAQFEKWTKSYPYFQEVQSEKELMNKIFK